MYSMKSLYGRICSGRLIHAQRSPSSHQRAFAERTEPPGTGTHVRKFCVRRRRIGHGSAANLPFGCYQVWVTSAFLQPLACTNRQLTEEPQTDSHRGNHKQTPHSRNYKQTLPPEPQTDTSQRSRRSSPTVQKLP